MSHPDDPTGSTSSAVLDPPAPAEAPTATRTILLVDRAPLFLKLEATLLARSEYRLLTATSGAGALEIIAREKLDLVLLDRRLPDVAGEEVVRAIRMSPDNARTPVLLVTAPGRMEEVDRCLDAGGSALLFKPVTGAALAARVQELLDVPARRHVRTLVRLGVEGEQGARLVFGTTVNLSESGILLESDAELAPGEAVDLRFFLPGDDAPVLVSSRVVRRANDEGSGVQTLGLEFVSLGARDRLRLRRFVEDCAASASA